jgi:hypothetical protein
MKVTTASLSYHKDIGPHLAIEEKGLTVLVLEHLGDEAFHVLGLLTPGWLWKVGCGPPDEEMGDGIRAWNLGHVMSEAAQWAGRGFGTWRRYRNVGTVPLTAAQVHELFPGADPLFSGDSTDAMNQRPGDWHED